jgi:hypothetical protein
LCGEKGPKWQANSSKKGGDDRNTNSLLLGLGNYANLNLYHNKLRKGG